MDSTRLQSSWSHKDHTMGERDKPHSYRREPSAPRRTTPPSSWRRWRWDDLAVEIDDEHVGGGWSPPEVDSGSVSPLRSSPAAAFCLSVSGFVFLCCLPWCSESSSSSGLRALLEAMWLSLSPMVWSLCDHEHCNIVELMDVFPLHYVWICCLIYLV